MRMRRSARSSCGRWCAPNVLGPRSSSSRRSAQSSGRMPARAPSASSGSMTGSDDRHSAPAGWIRRRSGRLQMLTARVSDGSATISATWFNQPWLERQLQAGTRVRLRGRQGRYGFDVRSFDIGDGEATADFAPVYPASEEITPKKLRELVGAALPSSFADPLLAELKERERLPQRADALWALHRPRSLAEAEAGRRRLAFDELLLLQIAIARRRREREGEVAPALGEAGDLLARYREVLPFRFTAHQERAIRSEERRVGK